MAESDAAISKYFGQHLALFYNKEIKALKEKQNVEINKILSKQNPIENPGAYLTPTSATLHNVSVQMRQGEWTSKHLEYCCEKANEAIVKNGKVKQDLGMITECVRYAMVAKLCEKEGSEKKGVAKYEELSKKYGGDLAQLYVIKRLQDNFVNMMAKKEQVDSEVLKVLSKGLQDSFIGKLVISQANFSEMEKGIKEKANPLTGVQRHGAEAISFITDFFTLSGGISIKGLATTVSFEAAGRASGFALEEKKVNEFSKDVFGDEGYMDKVATKGRKTNKGVVMTEINDVLNYKLNVRAVRDPKTLYDANEARSIGKEINKELYAGNNIQAIVEEEYAGNNIKYKKTPPPAWMLQKGEGTCLKLAKNFLAIAVEMRAKNMDSHMMGAKKMSYQEVVQRAYHYAVAYNLLAAKRVESEQQPRVQTQASTSTNVNKTSNRSSKGQTDLQTIYGSPQSQSQPQAQTVQQPMNQQMGMMPQNVQATQQNTGGWSNFLNSYGLNGIGDLGNNFGYVAAMLPDMLVNMFTGKSRVKLEDNLLPVSAIILSLFVKSKFLKFLLLGMGGANLLNKLAHESMEKDGISTSNQTKKYVTHTPESQDSRIRDVEIKGNTMLASIDGSPYVITLDDRTIDAYYKGVLPKENIANAVLRQFDDQAVIHANAANYERTMAQSEDRRQNVGIK